MKNRKLQQLLLVVLLVAVAAVGIFLLVRQPKAGESGPSTDALEAQQPGSTAAPIDRLNNPPVHYRLADQTEVEAPDVSGWYPFYTVQDTVCRLSYTGKPDALFQLISMKDGTVLRDYGESYFLLSSVHSTLYLDFEGQLWHLLDDGEKASAYLLGLCEPGTEEKQTQIALPYEESGGPAAEFAVWNEYLILHYGFLDHNTLAVINTETEAYWTMDQVQSFCLDSSGALYCNFRRGNEEGQISHNMLERRSLQNGDLLWQQKAYNEGEDYDFPYVSAIGTLGDTSLFVLGERTTSNGSEQSGIYQVNTETGDLEALVVDFWVEEIDLETELERGFTSLAADSSGTFYIGLAGGTPETDYRKTWTLEPYLLEVDPSEVVTLTITAPYPVESIIGAVQMYQREHPEVQIVWDTQYLSREEFQKNAVEYKDQITLRTTTGDTGDLQMIVGAGIPQEVITDTDAFLDLAPYLDASPVKEELAWNLVKTLQGEDGAIRALPLGIIPNCYLYNQTLLEEQGISLNLETVTWSELLELAVQWKASGTDLSLTSYEPGKEKYARSMLLSSLLLANLYDAERPDGTVQLDQPYLRDLLTKLKTVWYAPQLVRGDGTRFTPGFLAKSLFFFYDSTTGQIDRVSATSGIEEREQIQIHIAPVPRGEVYKKPQGYGYCWGIPASSQKKDEAWKLLEFIISSKGLIGYVYSREAEVVNNVARENWYAEYEKTHTFSKGMDRGIFDQFQALRQYPYSRFDEIYGWFDAVQAPIEDYLNDKLTLDEAMELASDNWARLLLG